MNIAGLRKWAPGERWGLPITTSMLNAARLPPAAAWVLESLLAAQRASALVLTESNPSIPKPALGWWQRSA
ncbi:MAG: hypothetical protein ACRDPW_05840 [Mycobacteriales bacterium]